MNSTRAGELAHAAIAHRFYVAFNARNLDSLDKFMAEDIVDHNPAPGQTYGLAGVKSVATRFLRAVLRHPGTQ